MSREDSTPGYISSADLAGRFDAFYRDARDRLLLQTFALTGDLNVARSAVREAFVIAWHHWRKTSHANEPENAVRPIAWRKAVRRSGPLHWSRKQDFDEQTHRTLEALAALPVAQRKALVLTQLAAVSMDEMARELGVPLEVAERELQLGAAQFAMQLGIPTSMIPLSLNALSDVTRSATWPRVTIIRRAGAARRRAHTVVGVAAAVVALGVGGALATDATGARPTLAREGIPLVSGPAPAPPATAVLPDTALLSLQSVSDTLPGPGWRQGGTVDNSAGDGRVLPCQSDRYADPRGTAAWVRAFRNGPRKKATRTLTQFSEASAGDARARRTYRRTLRWFTSCPPPPGQASAVPEMQLVSTATVPGVADAAAVLVLRSITDRTTYVVGVARTGLFTTTASLAGAVPVAKANRTGVAELLTAAVGHLCALPGGGTCPSGTEPQLADRAPYPVGTAPWMVSEIDLPPVSQDHGPWIGTPPADLDEERVDTGAIGCDTVHLFGKFGSTTIRRNQFRTFLFGEGKLPPEVGLTQTVGALPSAAAGQFVKRLRGEIAGCPKKKAGAGTEVEELATAGSGSTALSAWRMTTALPGDRSVDYHLAVVRRGTSVSLLVYVAAPRAQMADPDWVALTRRALDRLARMAPYKG